MRNVLILTLFLAILTIGAVSAADSEVNNATYDEALSVPEADEAIYESEDDVLSAPDEVVDEDVLSAPDEVVDEDVLSAHDGDVLGYNYFEYQTYIYENVIVDDKYGDVVSFGSLSGNYYEYGNFTIKIKGEEYYNGKIGPYKSIYVRDLKKIPPIGNFTVEYSYSDANGNSFNGTKDVHFTYTFYVYILGGHLRTKDVDLKVRLPDGAIGNVSIVINNKTYKNVNLNSDGIASFDIDDFVLGFNNISAYYSGDSIYPAREVQFPPGFLNPIFNCPYIIFDGEDAYVSVTVPKIEEGIFVLSMGINDAYYYYDIEFEDINLTNVVNGTATIKMPKFEGEKDFLLKFIKDENFYTHENYFEYFFTALSTNMTTQIKAIATTEVKEGQSVQLQLLNEYGSAVPIDIEVDGELALHEMILFNQTDIILPDFSAGNHTIVVRTSHIYSPIHYLKIFNITVKEKSNVTENPKPADNPAGTSTNNANSNTNKVSNKISLSLKTVKVKKSAKKVILKATLKINGKAVKYKTVTFKFNGKTYKVKTNSKGIAKLTVKKSVLKKLKAGKNVKYQVAYSNKLVKKTATVKK